MMGDRLVGILVGANLFCVLMVLTPTSDHPANDANMRDSILATLDRRCQAIHAIDRVEVRDAPLSHPLIFRSGRSATWGKT